MVVHLGGLRACVSGSFRKAMREVQESVYALTDLGVKVLSPADPRVVARLGDFMFVASDKLRSVRLVQERHLQAIAASDFLWLAAPEGYVGASAAMEIGYAAAKGVRVFGMMAPTDVTLREFVEVVGGIKEAVLAVHPHIQQERTRSVLVDPHASVEQAQQGLEALERELLGKAFNKGPADWQESASGLVAVSKGR